MQPIAWFEGARRASAPAERLKEVRYRAAGFRETMLSASPVPYLRWFDLARVPYPTRYGLRDAAAPWVSPMLHILNRMVVVQYRSDAAVRTLLISPSDVHANARTPFFARLDASARMLGRLRRPLLAPVIRTVEEALALAGVRPEQVDFISYDHLHTQDLRRWIGPQGLFVNARLLVMRQEWTSAHGLLPTQSQWYCPDGLAGIDPSRVVPLDGDVMLGEGVALIRTPGHTEGNHSFVVRTPEGLVVTSENGVAADSYAPLASRIPGLARHARETGVEVILNGNTLEGSVDQYLSMVCEKEIAGRSARDGDFYNVVPSSELSAWWLFPGLAPTFRFGELTFGAPVEAVEAAR